MRVAKTAALPGVLQWKWNDVLPGDVGSYADAVRSISPNPESRRAGALTAVAT